MTKFDDKFRPLAVKLLAKFGKDVTLHERTESPYAMGSGMTAFAETAHVVKATPPMMNKGRHLGTGVESADTTVLMAAQDAPAVPKKGWELEIDTVRWTITNVVEAMSGELPAFYRLTVER